MRKIRQTVLFLFFLTIATYLIGQLYVNGHNISGNSEIKFMELIWKKNGRSLPENITVQYGKNQTLIIGKGVLTNRSGRRLRFGSINELVDYIKMRKWDEIKSYIQCYSGHSVVHFLFKK